MATRFERFAAPSFSEDMGFDWSVDVTLEYCVPIKDQGISPWYLLKNLAEYEPGAARRAQVPGTGVPLRRALRSRAGKSVIVRYDSEEFKEEEVNKEIESPTPLEARFHYSEHLAKWNEDRDFDVEYNSPNLISEAFTIAAGKVLQQENHSISLRLVHGGAYGEVGPQAKERAFFLTWKEAPTFPVSSFSSGGRSPDGWVDLGRGGVNVPWGVASLAVPPVPAGVAQKFQTLCQAFGLEMEGEPAWRMISVAGGG